MLTRRWLYWLERGALVTGLLCLGLWTQAQVRAWAYQSAESQKLTARAAEWESLQAAPPAPATTEPVREPKPHTAATPVRDRPAKARSGAPAAPALGRLEIPRLGIRAIVAEGTEPSTLDLAVGHIAQTARPGSRGNCGLAGHRDTFFRHLGDVHDGDVVRFVTAERTYTYRVQWSRVVSPERIDTLDPTRAPSLTLVTCYPFTLVGRAPKRFVVRARQVDVQAPLADLAHGSGGGGVHVTPVLMAAGR